MHFFGFPPMMGLRQYGKLLENAANTNLKFIFFWEFVILDQNANGKITSQDLFRFITTFPNNPYIEHEVLHLTKCISMAKSGLCEEGKSNIEEEAPV